MKNEKTKRDSSVALEFHQQASVFAFDGNCGSQRAVQRKIDETEKSLWELPKNGERQKEFHGTLTVTFA